jgi:ribose transport system permease protein
MTATPKLDTATPAVAPNTGRPVRRRGRTVGVWAERLALPGVWVLSIVIFGAIEPSKFLTAGNFSNIFGSQTVLFVLTMAVLLPSINGDFDLSLGTIAALCSMVTALLNVNSHMPILPACVIGLLVAMFVGFVNGLFVVYFGNDPFIITLGTSTIITGVVYWVSKEQIITGTSVGLTKWTETYEFLRIPIQFYYGIALMLIVWYVTVFTPWGQRALFVGQSRQVAKLSGIHVVRIRWSGFVLAGLLAGLAGILSVGTTGSASPIDGSALLLPAYAGAFLGLTSITPGRFNAIGAGVAVYFLSTGVAGLQLLGADNYVQQLFYGGALVIAVSISRLIRRK